MHNHHISPALIRGRIRRALDPCAIQTAELWRDGKRRCTLEVWRYQKSSFSAGLALALSGVLSGDARADRAMVLSQLPEGIVLQPEDELVFWDGSRWRIASAAPWPAYTAPAVVTLTLTEKRA